MGQQVSLGQGWKSSIDRQEWFRCWSIAKVNKTKSFGQVGPATYRSVVEGRLAWIGHSHGVSRLLIGQCDQPFFTSDCIASCSESWEISLRVIYEELVVWPEWLGDYWFGTCRSAESCSVCLVRSTRPYMGRVTLVADLHSASSLSSSINREAEVHLRGTFFRELQRDCHFLH